jgi:hypothetical protein
MLMTHQDAAGYRRKAEECRAKAAKATDHVTRAEWIMMAQGWDVLAHHAEKDEKPG